MIGIASVIFDPLGAIYVYRDQLDITTIAGLSARERRTTKYKTLDGGVSIVDTGYAVGDRSLAVKILNATPEQVATVVRLSEMYSEVVLTTPDGAFRANPGAVEPDGANIKINLSFSEEA